MNRTFACVVIIVSAALAREACAAEQPAGGLPGWGTIYNDTKQAVTFGLYCGSDGPKKTFTLQPHETLSLRRYSRYELDFPGINHSYVVDALPPTFEKGAARRLTQWQTRFYHIGLDDDGTFALYRGVPGSLVRKFKETFRASLTSSGMAGKLTSSDPIIWRFLQNELIEQTVKDCLDDYMGSRVPLRFDLSPVGLWRENDDAESRRYILNILTGDVPLSPETRTFVSRCIAAVYNVKVQRVTSDIGGGGFLLLASHLAPTFRNQDGQILLPNIIKLVQEQLQESKLRAAEIHDSKNGIVANTDWLRITEVPDTFQGADIRWRLHIKAIRKHSDVYKEDYLDYSCDIEVKTKPRSAHPNKYRMISVPSRLTVRLEELGKKTDSALETIPGAFERRVYQILTGKKDEEKDSK